MEDCRSLYPESFMNTVSVIIPTYKNRGGLSRSIDSVLTQDYDGLIEIIVVDDNSPNTEFRISTENLMHQYEDNPKVIYIQHEINKNGAAARNTGIKAAKGDYIAFLDDDDIFLPGKLSKQVQYLIENPKFSAAYCLAQRQGKPCSQRILMGNCSREILLLESNFFTPSLIFCRQALFDINGFDESFRRHQDYELMLRFFGAGFSIGCVPEVLIEIGNNLGENIPSGSQIEKLKMNFFEKFQKFIEIEDEKTPGFVNQVYAKHYAGVFLNHIRHHHFFSALKTLRYAIKAPAIFYSVLYRSLIVHLKGEA